MPKIAVYHAGYGCDTGCCGHVIEIDDEEVRGSFTWDHPDGEDKLEWAREFIKKELGEEHVADLDWESSFVLDD